MSRKKRKLDAEEEKILTEKIVKDILFLGKLPKLSFQFANDEEKQKDWGENLKYIDSVKEKRLLEEKRVVMEAEKKRNEEKQRLEAVKKALTPQISNPPQNVPPTQTVQSYFQSVVVPPPRVSVVSSTQNAQTGQIQIQNTVRVNNPQREMVQNVTQGTQKLLSPIQGSKKEKIPKRVAPKTPPIVRTERKSPNSAKRYNDSTQMLKDLRDVLTKSIEKDKRPVENKNVLSKSNENQIPKVKNLSKKQEFVNFPVINNNKIGSSSSNSDDLEMDIVTKQVDNTHNRNLSKNTANITTGHVIVISDSSSSDDSD